MRRAGDAFKLAPQHPASLVQDDLAAAPRGNATEDEHMLDLVVLREGVAEADADGPIDGLDSGVGHGHQILNVAKGQFKGRFWMSSAVTKTPDLPSHGRRECSNSVAPTAEGRFFSAAGPSMCR